MHTIPLSCSIERSNEAGKVFLHDASGAWLADVNSRHADEICKALNEAEALSKVAQCASELRGKIPDIDCIIGMRELIESIAALQSLRAESKSE